MGMALPGRRGPLLIVGLTALLLIGPSAAGAAEVPDITFGAAPAPGSSSTGGFFTLTMRPGQSIRQSLRINNASPRAGVVRLDTTDATTGPRGGVVFPDTEVPVRGVGRWIKIDQTLVPLPRGAVKDISFTVTVPLGTRPGVHLAGVIAYTAEERKAASASSSGGAQAILIVRSRRALAVQVTVPGPAEPVLEIRSVKTDVGPSGLGLLVEIANTGAGLTKAKGTVTLSGPEPFSAPLTIDTVVAQTSFRYPVPWSKQPRNGEYRAQVTLTYDGGRTAEYSGTFRVGAAEEKALSDRVTGRTPETPTGLLTASRLLLAGGLLVASLLLLLGLAMVRRRRRAARHGRHGR